MGLLALCFSIVPVVFSIRFCRYIDERTTKRPKDKYVPKASLLVPCKGLDPDFRNNIEVLFHQDYPDYEVVFITATKDDPAYPVLDEIIKNNLHVSARLYTAGIVQGRSQKINNQLKGLKEVKEDSGILVFIDSDARPGPEFLKNLIAPLKDPAVGVATGFRWYLPVKGGFSSLLRSTWNGGGLAFVTDRSSNYAWGGAMAIRKKTFEEIGMADYWKNTLSDDLTLTTMVRDAGLKIEFVPQCLVVSHEDCNFSEMLEWTNRQTIISKVYHPKLWQRIALAHGIGNLILGLGTVLLASFLLGIVTDKNILFASILMLAMIPMEMINGLFLLPAVRKMLPDHRERIWKLVWIYCLLAPLASLLALYNTIYSLFTNRITWRGVTYEMRSPTETIVCE